MTNNTNKPEPEFCEHPACIRKVLPPHIYCDAHQDVSSTPGRPEPTYRHKKTGSIYSKVQFENGGLVTVWTQAGSSYLVSAKSIEQVEPTPQTDAGLRSDLRDVVTRNGAAARIPELLEDELDKLLALIAAHDKELVARLRPADPIESEEWWGETVVTVNAGYKQCLNEFDKNVRELGL